MESFTTIARTTVISLIMYAHKRKNTLLQHIMEATGACIYYDIYGRLAVAIDKAQENALAVYNPQNIINIQNKKVIGTPYRRFTHKVHIERNDLYQEETYLVMREEKRAAATVNR